MCICVEKDSICRAWCYPWFQACTGIKECISQGKEDYCTDTCSSMDASPKHAEWDKPLVKQSTLLFHLNEVLHYEDTL
jgi:hypothetical protein